MVLSPDALSVSGDGRRATLEVADAPVIDQPRWPAHDTPTYGARIHFRAEWIATDEPVVYEDALRHFRFEGWRATARLQARVEVPEFDFRWESDPIETSSADFAIIGEEANGRYYTA